MPKVYLDPGHGGKDNGAAKYIVEDVVNLAMAQACRECLEAHGVTVKMSRETDTYKELTDRIKECNAWGADLAVSCHNNAAGGDGFEVFHTIGGGVGKTLAENINAEVLKIGQNSRGVKTRKNSQGRDYYGFIRQTKAPAVICEGVFVDTKADAAQADEAHEQKAFGVAYAKGILKTLGIPYKEPASAGSGAAYEKWELLDNMNLRSKPSASSMAVGWIPKGTVVMGKPTQDGEWLYTSDGVKTGYIRICVNKVYCKKV